MNREIKIKEQPVEIITFKHFEEEISASHLSYLKRQIPDSDYERLKSAIKNEDIVECAAITNSWHIELENIHSGVFRKSTLFTKNENGSYHLKNKQCEFNFNENQILFVLKNETTIAINLYQVDSLITKKQ